MPNGDLHPSEKDSEHEEEPESCSYLLEDESMMTMCVGK